MYQRKITLYVQSTKSVAGTQEFETIWTIGSFHGTRETPQVKYAYVLSEEQEAIVTETQDICSEYGFELKIVDVTREGILHKTIHESIKGIDIFPALLSDSGRWIEGITSKDQVKAFLSKENETWF